MLTRLTAAAVATAVLFAAAPAAAQPASTGVPVPCERACMEGLAGKVLAALANHDAKSLPLAKNARYTENGHGLVLGMRVKLQVGLISEIELITYRTGAGPAWNDAGYGNLEKMGRPKPVWNAPPSGRRLSRQELAKVANYYFDGIQNNDGKGYYPFTDDCDRIENGAETTNNPGIVKMGPIDIGGMGCKAQFSTGLYGVVTLVHDRRFAVIDEEQQAVFSLAVFDHCGCKKSLTMPNGTKVDVGFFNKPSSILLAEAFKIDGGLIEQVEAVGVGVPYHMRPGWKR
jgi:hypothetical protein